MIQFWELLSFNRPAKLTKLEVQDHESASVWLFSGAAVKISIIIVHFFGEDHLSKCLNSIPEHPSISELIVVDNGSKEGFAGRTRSTRKDVIVISNEKNIGYGAAVNKASGISNGDVLLILNQDIVFQKDTLVELINSIEQNENTYIWGATLQNMNGEEQGSAGPFPTLANWIARLFKPRSQRKYYSTLPDPDSPVEWVTGAFLAIRRYCLDSMQGFDIDYFMYYEDVDLCKRAANKGFRTALAKNVKATHSAPIAAKNNMDNPLAIEIRKSQLRYFLKHRPHWEYATLVWITRFYFLLKGWKFH